MTPFLVTGVRGGLGAQQVREVTPLVGEEATPYVGEALRRLREEVGGQAAVLGFVGAPFTLASYIVEGGSSKNYTHVKRLAFGQPEVLHALLAKLADGIADYVRYQVTPRPPRVPCGNGVSSSLFLSPPYKVDPHPLFCAVPPCVGSRHLVLCRCCVGLEEKALFSISGGGIYFFARGVC